MQDKLQIDWVSRSSSPKTRRECNERNLKAIKQRRDIKNTSGTLHGLHLSPISNKYLKQTLPKHTKAEAKAESCAHEKREYNNPNKSAEMGVKPSMWKFGGNGCVAILFGVTNVRNLPPFVV